MDNEKNIHAYPLNQIYFYLTEGCNLCCRHCWIAPKFQNGERVYQNLSVDLFKSVIQQAKELGLAGIKLTGGEPLLHPEIKQILEFICQEGIKLTLETNGILLTLELARLIARCKNPFVSVSIDSPDFRLGCDYYIHQTLNTLNHEERKKLEVITFSEFEDLVKQ